MDVNSSDDEFADNEVVIKPLNEEEKMEIPPEVIEQLKNKVLTNYICSLVQKGIENDRRSSGRGEDSSNKSQTERTINSKINKQTIR